MTLRNALFTLLFLFTFTLISAEPKAALIDKGFDHLCAVISEGVVCWGKNQDGQLGDGTTITRLNPVLAIPPLSGATAVATSGNTSCAVVKGGVQCWGNNSRGQLGIGSTTSQATPVQTIPVNSGATAISLGNQSACALINEGVKCWGRTLDDNQLTPLDKIAPNSGVTEIHSMGGTTWAIAHGGLLGWGSNQWGKIGDGTRIDRDTPVEVFPPQSGVTAFNPKFFPCAVVHGGVRCWGFSPILHPILFQKPVGYGDSPIEAIAADSGVTAITVNQQYICAVVDAGVQCTTSMRFHTGTYLHQMIPPQSGVTAIDSGNLHTCATTTDGVTCWGENPDGQLGIQNTPIPLENRCKFWGNPNSQTSVSIYSGTHSIPFDSVPTALKASSKSTYIIVNGKIKSWGSNSDGLLGDGSTEQRETPIEVALDPSLVAIFRAADAIVIARSAHQARTRTAQVALEAQNAWQANSQDPQLIQNCQTRAQESLNAQIAYEIALEYAREQREIARDEAMRTYIDERIQSLLERHRDDIDSIRTFQEGICSHLGIASSEE